MTIDEAINHAEEVAYQKDLESGFETDNERYVMTDKERTTCNEYAEGYRQVAEWLKELKRLKKQQPCEDAISRAEVFNILSKNYCNYSVAADGSCVPGNYREGIYDEIKALPSVAQKTNWIPVSEKLPRKNE